jgi:hypothetical protein
MKRQEIGPGGGNGGETAVSIVEVGAIFAPVMPVGHKLELVTNERVKYVDDPEARALIVRFGCIRRY